MIKVKFLVQYLAHECYIYCVDDNKNHNIRHFLPCLENSYLSFKIHLGWLILQRTSLMESGNIYTSFMSLEHAIILITS